MHMKVMFTLTVVTCAIALGLKNQLIKKYLIKKYFTPKVRVWVIIIWVCDLEKAFPPSQVPLPPLVSQPHSYPLQSQRCLPKAQNRPVPPPLRLCCGFPVPPGGSPSPHHSSAQPGLPWGSCQLCFISGLTVYPSPSDPCLCPCCSLCLECPVPLLFQPPSCWFL